jgi:hypothetical protein
MQSIHLKVSRDPHIFILSQRILRSAVHLIMAGLLGLIIVVPAVVVDSLRVLTTRFIATFLGTTFFIVMLSLLTKAKSVEIFIAAAT